MGCLASLLLLSALAPDGGPIEVVSTDGGEVPTVAPDLTPKVAPLLAPELVADGGVVVADPSLSVYDVDVPLETSLAGGAFALYAVADYLIKPTLQGDVSCPQSVGNGRCNPADLTAFDRYAVGRHSKEWTLFSDVALAASIALPVVYLAVESVVLPTSHPWKDFAGDVLVVTEAMALTSAFQTIMKFAFRRPRPARYQPVDVALSTFDQELSFPSGHTCIVASATTAFTTTVFLRHPSSPMRWVALGAGVAATALTGIARVEGGHHFPTDVLVGAMIGAFSGFALPYLHRRQPKVVPVATVQPSAGAASFGLAGTF